MEKQRGNPKFNFLFGGESHAYYRWRVGQEQASLYDHHSQQPGLLNMLRMFTSPILTPLLPNLGIPSLMSQQPQAPPYGAPPSSQAPGYGQQQQHQGQGSYPPSSGFSQPQQGGSWGPPTSESGGQQPLLSQRKLALSLSLSHSLTHSLCMHVYPHLCVSIC